VLIYSVPMKSVYTWSFHLPEASHIFIAVDVMLWILSALSLVVLCLGEEALVKAFSQLKRFFVREFRELARSKRKLVETIILLSLIIALLAIRFAFGAVFVEKGVTASLNLMDAEVIDIYGQNVTDSTVYATISSNRSSPSTGILFNITVYPRDTRYTYLQLDASSSTIPSNLNLNMTLISSTGEESTAIEIVDGVVVADTTSDVPLQGEDNYVFIEGYIDGGGQASLMLNIVSCSTPDLSVCMVVPITVEIST
ncbi:MAG: hypothetical protein DRO12_06715, partial [Thermoprotei archaeon]